MAGIGLALLAGLLSTLSPCVLPLIPIVIGTALGEHRFGPVALALGLALSFVVIGLFVATVGFAAGLDQELFRSIAAVLLIPVGGALLMPRLQRQLVAAAGSGGKALMGVMLVAIGARILTGLDKRIETILVEASPAWLTELTTRF